MKRGEKLQRLVAALEKAIGNNSAVQVISPAMLPDKDTGRLREHDVLLIFTMQHHKLLVALECRDRGRPVGVPDVEGFKRKCERTGVHKGAFVSSTGFTQSARTKAAAEEIGCLSLEEAETLDWCQAPGFEQRMTEIIGVPAIEVGLEGEADLSGPLFDGDHRAITQELARRMALKCLESRPPEDAATLDEVAKREPVLCEFHNDGAGAFYLRDGAGHPVHLNKMIIRFAYRVHYELRPFNFISYLSAEGRISDAAIADFDHPSIPGSIVMHKTEDGRIKVTFVPRSSVSATPPELQKSRQSAGKSVRRRD